jgi:hypothetical protein
MSTQAIEPMAGRGFYNRHSSLQAAGIAAVLPLWEKIAHAVPIGDENLVIADYGSSQGHNSMLPIRMAIEVLRRKAGLDRTVEVIHTDLPSNDFGSLFKALEEAPTSYLVNERLSFCHRAFVLRARSAAWSRPPWMELMDAPLDEPQPC